MPPTAESLLYLGTIPDLLDRPDISIMFFCRISGIPYLFGSGPLPTAWSVGGGAMAWDGETYTWLNRFIVSDLAGVSQFAEPKAGLGVSGSLDVRILTLGTEAASDDPVRALFIRDLFWTGGATTTAYGALNANSSGPGSTWDVSATTGFAAAGYIYAGIETIYYDGTGVGPPPTFNDLTRGRYGSWNLSHRFAASTVGESVPRGEVIASWPLVWEGRLVEIWMAFGQTYDNGFVPFEDAGGDIVSQQIFLGVVAGFEEKDNEVVFHAASADQLLAQNAPSRFPVAAHLRWSEAPTEQVFIIGETNRYLFWEWYIDDAATAAIGVLYNTAASGAWAAAGVEIGAGIYTLDNLANIIYQTFSDPARPNPGGTAVRAVAIHPSSASEDAQGENFRYEICISFNATLNGYGLRLLANGTSGRASFLQLLGYTEDTAANCNRTAVPAVAGYSFPAPKPPPAFWIPGRRRGTHATQHKLYVRPETITGPAFDPSPGWDSDDGTACLAWVQLDKWGAFPLYSYSTTLVGGVSYGVLTPLSANRNPESPIDSLWNWDDYVVKYREDKGGDILQPVVLTGISLGRALLYLILGGSGVPGTMDPAYDQGWDGSGLALPARVVNQTEMIAAGRTSARRRDQIWLNSVESLRKWIADELRVDQMVLVPSPDWDAGTGPTLTLLDTNAPQEAIVGGVYEIDEDTIYSGTGRDISIERGEGNVINAIDMELQPNPVTGKFAYTVTQRQLTSIETFGERGKITLKCRSILGAGTADAVAALAKNVADVFWDRYAFPYEIITATIAHARSWTIRVGDVVKVASGYLPDISSGRLGITECYGRVYRKEDRFVGSAWSSKIVMLARKGLAYRISVWGPSCQLNSIVGGVNTTWLTEHNRFSDSGEAYDLSWFAAGDYVLLSRRGSTTVALRTIASVNGDVVVFTAGVGTLGAGGDIVMTFYSYSSVLVTDRQRQFVANSLAGGTLPDGAGGTDLAFVYQG